MKKIDELWGDFLFGPDGLYEKWVNYMKSIGYEEEHAKNFVAYLMGDPRILAWFDRRREEGTAEKLFEDISEALEDAKIEESIKLKLTSLAEEFLRGSIAEVPPIETVEAEAAVLGSPLTKKDYVKKNEEILKLVYYLKGLLMKLPVLKTPLKKLKDEKAKLDLQIRKIEEEIADMERQITMLFEEGKLAKTRSEELTIATKIKLLSQIKKNLQAIHAFLISQMMLLSNFIIIKENGALLRSSPLYEMLKKMPPAEELEKKLMKFQLEKDLMKTPGYTDQAIGVGYEEDEEIKKIVETMKAVRKGDLTPEEAMRVV